MVKKNKEESVEVRRARINELWYALNVIRVTTDHIVPTDAITMAQVNDIMKRIDSIKYRED